MTLPAKVQMFLFMLIFAPLSIAGIGIGTGTWLVVRVIFGRAQKGNAGADLIIGLALVAICCAIAWFGVRAAGHSRMTGFLGYSRSFWRVAGIAALTLGAVLGIGAIALP